MHNVFKISLVVRREALGFTLSVEGCTDLKNIVHLYRVRVTKFSTRGGATGSFVLCSFPICNRTTMAYVDSFHGG